MTDEERAAMEWLEQSIQWSASSLPGVLKRLLAEPRMPRPEELTDKDLLNMWNAAWDTAPAHDMRAAYRALYDRRTRPQTVWRVSWSDDTGNGGHEDCGTTSAAAAASERILHNRPTARVVIARVVPA